MLEESNETLTNLVQELSWRVMELNNSVVELNALNKVLEERWLNALNQVQTLNETLVTVRSEAEALKGENNWLRITGIIFATLAVFTLLVTLGLSRLRKTRRGEEAGE